MKLKEYRVKANPCPKCGHHLSGATGFDGKPGPLDWSICCECLSLLEFQPDMTLRVISPEELLASPPADQAMVHEWIARTRLAFPQFEGSPNRPA